MSLMQVSALKAGRIFGDQSSGEYVYMPAGEMGIMEPVCVYETNSARDDVTLEEALRLIRVRSLSLTRHPRLGYSSC